MTISPSASFDRSAFEQIVASRSPLRPEQIDKLLGGVTGDNKRLAWEFLRTSSKMQITMWSFKQGFPEAVIERVK